MKFADPYDRQLATAGPAGLFTLTHDGDLQFDLFRTRDWRRRFLVSTDVIKMSWNHCVCVDTATQWPMYVLITSNELVCSDAHTITKVFDTVEDAQLHIKELKSTMYKSSGETPSR